MTRQKQSHTSQGTNSIWSPAMVSAFSCEWQRQYENQYLTFLPAFVVPSNQRAAAVEGYGEISEESLKDEGDGWVSTPLEHRQGAAEEEIPSLEPSSQAVRAATPNKDNDDDDNIPDIDDLALEDAEEDEVKFHCLFTSNDRLQHQA